ncbi:MAG: hypothetical protein KJ592_05040 [Nanoarchaeota archaeon]|nr:hypothetical protein [Nanoarchaeota archaeon]
MNKYPIVGYGSLLSHSSLRETIKDKRFQKILVKGYKRIFNLIDGKTDILNLEKSKTDHFNAILFYVNDEELKKLKLREDEYNLEKVDVFDFTTKEKISEAYISIDYIIDIDSGKKQPNKEYFTLCRSAAYELGNDFGKYWDETTYTSSNEKITNWIKKNKEYDKL